MLSLGPRSRIFLALDPVDMRKSFDGLAGCVRRLELDPEDGHLYVFLNRRRTLMKALYFDRNGWCVLAKRLEKGTYQLPAVDDSGRTVRLEAVELGCILDGIDLACAPRRRRYRRRAPRES